MSVKSEFSLASFNKDNAPRPAEIDKVLKERIGAVTVLVNYWISVLKVLEKGVDCTEKHSVADLLYKVDLIKMQERQVLELKNTATMMVNSNFYVEETFMILMDLHRTCHHFLTAISPVLAKNLLYLHDQYVEKHPKQ